ncbi:hypothetical protein B9Z55_013680 [Caenorhabditis nigoni]|uniref:SGNH domain-containing protein n=1 Tax=Caenorhabditis nigoni TaxID=1611254 RepID=A0A2G5U2U8_9PELO|nr:hypothetical protein B9Z55_013680 [Caenorhabditis nigoni]
MKFVVSSRCLETIERCSIPFVRYFVQRTMTTSTICTPTTISHNYQSECITSVSIPEESNDSSLLLNPTVKKKKKELKKKRQDLQGIRGIAILSVICFHFFPTVFPNGYLGVDQFFVLSGFLMCMLLQRSSKSLAEKESIQLVSSLKLTFQFYYKRLKRILPLYLLVILLSLIALIRIFPDTAYETNLESGRKALLLISNRVATQEEDYFTMLDIAIDIFTHTWSLSVEVQFYIIVPILYLIPFKFFKENYQVLFYGFFGLISYWYSIFSCSDNQAFNSMFARIWQFMIGMIAFKITDSRISQWSEKNGIMQSSFVGKTENMLKYLLIFGMISIVMYSRELLDKVLRWYLKLSWFPMISICFLLFFINVLALNENEIEDWLANRQPGNFKRLDGLDGNKTYNFDEAEHLNSKWSKKDIKNLIHATCEYESGPGPFGWCRHKGLKGKYKVMIIGNSWAANHARIIYEECGYKAKSILQGSAIGCDPLYAYNYGGQRCKDNVKTFEKRVAAEKPDYVFLLSRFIDISDNVNATNVEDDPIYQSMRNQTEKIMKHVKHKMFILTSIPEIEHENVAKIVSVVKSGKDLVKFDKTFVHTSPDSARQRHAKLIEECKRCVPIDYKPLLWNTTTETWRYYDVKNSGLSYMTQIDHLTYHGLELVRHLYTSICRKL